MKWMCFAMKKWLIGLAGLCMAVSLSACSKTVATTSGGKITESEYYKKMKESSTGKQVLQQMILNDVLEHDYGSKVSDKAVDAEYNTYKEQYGDSFGTILSQNGYTKSSFKEDNIRPNLLLEQAIIANTKFTKKKLEKQWKEYQPKITVAHILVDNEDTAKTIISDLQKDGSYKNFKKLVKKYSTDTGTKSDGGKLPAFDNTDTSLVTEFKDAAFKLKQGQFTTEPVKTDYGYHVIYCIKNPGKKGTMKDHEKELKQQIAKEIMNSDTTKVQSVVSKVLKNGKVSIKDSDLKDILADYLDTSSSSSNK
jgi:foldase protein PrsA